MRGRRAGGVGGVGLGLGLVVAVAAACGGSPQGSAPDGACEAPVTTVSTADVAAGDEVTVTVRLGCVDTPDGLSDETVEDVEVVWQQGGASSVLAVADSDGQGVVVVTVTVPQDAEAGPATLTAGPAEPATVRVAD